MSLSTQDVVLRLLLLACITALQSAGQHVDLTNRCPLLAPITNGIITYPSGLVFPSEAFYTCNIGYRLHGPSNRACQSYVGFHKQITPTAWKSPSSSTCKVNNCTAPHLADGQVLGTSPYFMASCKDGFKLVGNVQITCISDTETTPMPACQPFICTPPAISHGITSSTEPTHTTKCNSGFELVGDPIVKCASNKTATTLPTCKRYQCTSPPRVTNGHVTVQGYLRGGTAHVACNAGYNLHGANTTTCVSNGSWSHTLGNCLSTTCNYEFNISNGVVVLNGTPPYLVGSSIYVQCISGYTGGGIVLCEADGTWTNTTCTRIPCEVFQSVENGVALLNDDFSPTLAVLVCNEGYHLIGTALLHCSTTGVWSAPIPMCKQGSSSAAAGSSDSSGATSNTTIIVGVASFLAGFLIPTVIYVCILKRRAQEHRVETTQAPVELCNKIDLPDLKENDAYGIGTSSDETHYDTI
ncbi:sushi, von Willebrand factor type A, EGF and pentraxin domain-containing protein 1-like [Sycon ciliatum]|uniref:sushi, von Willebrand factor type A, EGF and pentraxin domain-containing protein 1-like n=1 Tax=Sycon ciliatum TaxID=27933 RepID=UPI0031F6B628